MSHFMNTARNHFDMVASHVLGQLTGDEAVTLNLSAEDTLYVRFNANRVRQNTDVQQMVLALQLQSVGRTVRQSCTLSGSLEADCNLLGGVLQACRAEVAVLDVDPHQVPIVNHGHSDDTFTGALLAPQAVVQAILDSAQGCDLAGLYAGGVVIRANRNSAGQSHWFATESFFLDYSLYDGPKAAKGSYAGARWDTQAWATNLARTRNLLDKLKRPTVNVKPGQYRTYLAPRAFADLCWA
jgi:predicted Zn-dependent protease